MSTTVSIYLPDHIIAWVDEQAEAEDRNRSRQISKILRDVKEGRLIPSDKTSDEVIIKNTRQPPLART